MYAKQQPSVAAAPPPPKARIHQRKSVACPLRPVVVNRGAAVRNLRVSPVPTRWCWKLKRRNANRTRAVTVVGGLLPPFTATVMLFFLIVGS